MEFEVVYEAYFERIFKYILYMTSDATLAEDLTQETFLRVYKGNFRNEASISTYVHRIARNLVYDSYRRKALIKWITFNSSHDSTDQSHVPHEWLAASEDRRLLFEAVQNLKPEYREVIILRKIEELSMAETAEILKWNEVKVANTLRAAMKQLRTLLGGELDGFGQSVKGIE